MTWKPASHRPAKIVRKLCEIAPYDRHRIQVKSPFDRDFNANLKEMCQGAIRGLKDEDGEFMWVIDRNFVNEVIVLAEEYFPNHVKVEE